MSDQLNRIEDKLDRHIEVQSVFNGEMQEHIGKMTEFAEGVKTWRGDVILAHEALRIKHEAIVGRVRWIVGIGVALAFSITTAIAFVAAAL